MSSSAPPTRPPLEHEVKLKILGVRLDQYLAENFSDYSRSVIRKVIDAGAVLVNGAPAKASYKVRNRDRLIIRLPEPLHDVAIPEDIPLEILYEDEFLALINKPTNMVVHPAKGHWSGTLVNALQFHFDALSRENGEYRAGIVHRLDRDTSGVILIAKEEQTHRDLAMQFERRRVFKEYLALTAGAPDRDSDYIEGRIGRHKLDRVKMAVVANEEEEAKDACTFYEVAERFRGYALVKAQPRTGRTHQIRVHLASIGCPVLADKIYSGRDEVRLSELVPLRDGQADEVLMTRQALHAARLRFQHPRRGTWIEVEAPLPEDYRRALAALRQHRSLKRQA